MKSLTEKNNFGINNIPIVKTINPAEAEQFTPVKCDMYPFGFLDQDNEKIDNLIEFLNMIGADVKREEDRKIVINGKEKFIGGEIRVIRKKLPNHRIIISRRKHKIPFPRINYIITAQRKKSPYLRIPAENRNLQRNPITLFSGPIHKLSHP